jgi:hypothetical protein
MKRILQRTEVLCYSLALAMLVFTVALVPDNSALGQAVPIDWGCSGDFACDTGCTTCLPNANNACPGTGCTCLTTLVPPASDCRACGCKGNPSRTRACCQ